MASSNEKQGQRQAAGVELKRSQMRIRPWGALEGHSALGSGGGGISHFGDEGEGGGGVAVHIGYAR